MLPLNTNHRAELLFFHLVHGDAALTLLYSLSLARVCSDVYGKGLYFIFNWIRKSRLLKIPSILLWKAKRWKTPLKQIILKHAHKLAITVFVNLGAVETSCKQKKMNIIPLALFWSPLTPEESIRLFSCDLMLSRWRVVGF